MDDYDPNLAIYHRPHNFHQKASWKEVILIALFPIVLAIVCVAAVHIIK